MKDVELYASENVNKAVVGNKVDLGAARQVSKQEGKVSKWLFFFFAVFLAWSLFQAFADELRVPFFETSAVSICFSVQISWSVFVSYSVQKDGSGVSECFEKLGIAIRDRLLSSQTPV